MKEIAALFVESNGVYTGLAHVDAWDRERDARSYAGPLPVVAHPPCERWGHFWYGGLMRHKNGTRFKKGDDGGCFAAAVAAVRYFGGVLEHPKGSGAWPAFKIPRPPSEGGWIPGPGLGISNDWTCCVYQGHYGHLALKPTWLYYVGSVAPPELKWGKPAGDFRPISAKSFRSKAERDAAVAAGWRHTPRLSTKQRAASPAPFRDLLLGIAQRLADRRILGDLA